MNTNVLRTTCPFCGEHNDRMTGARSREDQRPSDGDISLCWECGEINIVDLTTDAGLRKPTKNERRVLDADQRIMDLRSGWERIKPKPPLS